MVKVCVLLDAVRSSVAKANLASCLFCLEASLAILLCVLSAVPVMIPRLASVADSVKMVSALDMSYQVLSNPRAELMAVFNCATV